MAQEIIHEGDSGLSCLNTINGNFTELYGAAQIPLKIKNVSANTTTVIPANSYVFSLYAIGVVETPTVRIGTTPNGTDIMADTVLNNQPSPVDLRELFTADTTFYITISDGTASFRFEIIYNFF